MTFEVNKNNIDVEGFSNGLKMTTINLLSNPQNKVLPPPNKPNSRTEKLSVMDYH